MSDLRNASISRNARMADAMKTKARDHRHLIDVQINLAELDSLDPLLRARIIDRAARKSMKEAKHAHYSWTPLMSRKST